MTDLTTMPARRSDLLVRPLGNNGRHVVKDPRTGEYYQIGEQEHFLLEQHDGKHSAAQICSAFQERFGEPLAEEEVAEFVEIARARGFLQEMPLTPGTPSPNGERRNEANHTTVMTEARAGTVGKNPASQSPAPKPKARQSILYWRKSLFDPDRLFNWMEPKIRFFWTPAFFLLSLGCIILAAVLTWTNGQELVSNFAYLFRWETVLMVWLTVALVTTCHEFAHGLTCKHHGGEVHEVGFLLLFFMPCFYCNVSDAWLFKEKSKRLWVTLAGGYFDLFLWALAVFVWRLTLQDTLLNYLAWVVLSVCGVRVFFNFNPLLKLDGYYLLSDWLETPNLRQRGVGHFLGNVRRLLWGAPRPPRQSRGKFLFVYGMLCWLFSIGFLTLILVGFATFLSAHIGWVGALIPAFLGLVLARGLFQGVTGGEVRNMILKRFVRTTIWLTILGGAMAALVFIEIDDRVNGSFRLRAANRAELRAPAAAFLREVYYEEGAQVSTGIAVLQLEIPDLSSRVKQKRAEVLETKANLRLLEIGSRPEEIAEQRQRVQRARVWRDLAEQDLQRLRQALKAEMTKLEHKIKECQTEMETALQKKQRLLKLRSNNAVSPEELEDAEKHYKIWKAQCEQAKAEKRAREAKGTLEAEGELARRDKELAEARAALTLLEAGSRPEKIEAERARLVRLQEEVCYLEQLQAKLVLHSPVAGVVSTPHLKEKIGQYFEEGELICVVEEDNRFEAEIVLAEQDLDAVRIGQKVDLKARSLPFDTITATVERIAPTAEKGDVQSQVTVSCWLPRSTPALRSGLTGYARIYTERRPLGEIALQRVLRYLRTEFWW